jgi:hypothetical protein
MGQHFERLYQETSWKRRLKDVAILDCAVLHRELGRPLLLPHPAAHPHPRGEAAETQCPIAADDR